MSTRNPRNIAASVRARLLHIARTRGDDFQLVLTRYANERLLYCLSVSSHAERFVLKGATLFTLWNGEPHRATRDVDLHGFGDPSPQALKEVFLHALSLDVDDDDGVAFDLSSLVIGPIREDQSYSGFRIEVLASGTTARVRLQVDIGFGDAITPRPIEAKLPVLLDTPAPRLRVYPRETVVAEKTEAMVQLGLLNKPHEGLLRSRHAVADVRLRRRCPDACVPSNIRPSRNGASHGTSGRAHTGIYRRLQQAATVDRVHSQVRRDHGQ